MSYYPYVYPYSAAEAKRLGELEQWRESNRANRFCKDAIESAIRENFDGMHLKHDCTERVLEKYGYKRVAWVLANTLQEKADDGRFSRENKAWASRVYIPSDKENNYTFVVDSHPAVLDGFINQYRTAYQALGLFDSIHCEPNTHEQDFEGKVLVMSPDSLREDCWRPQDQLWLCTGGFGSRPNSRGRAVFATCLGDGEESRFDRHDFIGVLKEEFLPEWAMDGLTQYQRQEADDVPGMRGPEMM